MTLNEHSDVDLPRAQVGSNPQHLLLSLLVDYWYGREEHLPSAGLVSLVTEMGITPGSARAAIGRLARRRVLAASKEGRRTFYGLTPGAALALHGRFDRVMRFGMSDRPWDGLWTCVVFSVPEDQRDARYVLRTRLRWLGYAPLYDGVWVSPVADHDQTVELLETIAVASATVVRSSVTYAMNGGEPLAAWDLGAVRARYDDFVEEFEPLLQRIDNRQVGAVEALLARTRVLDFWRELSSVDPELPENLLPAGWPRRDAQRLFAEIYDGLGALAEARVRQVLAEHAPELAQKARHLITASFTSEVPSSPAR